jgi:hypothetical protein
MSLRIFLGNSEITDYVPDKPRIRDVKEFGRLSVVNQYKTKLINTDRLFSIGNPNSILGNNPIGTPFVIQDDTSGSWVTIFEGEVLDGPFEQNNEAQLNIANILMRYLKEEVSYSATSKTPASAALEILQASTIPDINIDSDSFMAAHNVLNDNSIHLDISYVIGDGNTIIDALNSLAMFSAGFIYTFKNKIYFKLRSSSLVGVKAVYTENEYRRIKRWAKQTKYMLNDYSITYGPSSLVAIDSSNNNTGSDSRSKYNLISTFELQGGSGENIYIPMKMVHT